MILSPSELHTIDPGQQCTALCSVASKACEERCSAENWVCVKNVRSLPYSSQSDRASTSGAGLRRQVQLRSHRVSGVGFSRLLGTTGEWGKRSEQNSNFL